MKIKESYWHEASKSDNKDKPNWTKDARRQNPVDHSGEPNKFRQTDSPLKEETKFAHLLESPAKLQKPSQQRDDAGDESGEDRKDEKKHSAQEQDSLDGLTKDGRTEKYDGFGGSSGGGQGGFGMGAGVNQLHLNENFAARSILHIADLERLISTVRTQTSLGGRREIILQLKRSVLDGLRVKIVTDPGARVQIEFLAANEKVRSEIERHAPELADILRGRGINLETLKTTLEDDSRNEPRSSEENSEPISSGSFSINPFHSTREEQFSDNTFDDNFETGGKNYKA